MSDGTADSGAGAGAGAGAGSGAGSGAESGEAAAAPVRIRGASESLLSIVLVLEAIVVVFVMTTVFGLRLVPGGVAFLGGTVLFLALILVARVVRTPVGRLFGWALQVILVLLGLVISLMYVIGALFFALWIYCFFVGRRLDRRNAGFRSQLDAQTEE